MIDRFLILAPHTDDGEYGCGGTIARFAESGEYEIFYIAFSACEKSVPEEYPPDILKKEVKKAVSVLGIPENHLEILDYPVREFLLHRQDILDDMIHYKKQIDPDVVMLPCSSDTHQDHHVISQEGFRAFKDTTILGYEVPWNMSSFNIGAFICLQERHVMKKIEAMKCYKSQYSKDYIVPEAVKGLAKVRGTQVKCYYAEAFEVTRLVIT